MPKNVIILGMARSGTSLTASIFANTGYYVDEEKAIAPKNHMNPTGYWESTTLLKFNEYVLRSSGFDHDNTWIYAPITGEQVALVDKFKPGKEFGEFLTRFEAHSPWVWKDPRLCYTLGIWWPLLDKTNTVVILVRRDPEAIYNSFLRIGWRKQSKTSRAATLDRIQAHIKNAERLIIQYEIPAISFHYEDYKKSPQKIVDMVNQACGLNIQTSDLGYNDSFNHDKLSGKLGSSIDRMINQLPLSWIKAIKRLVPRSLLKRLYPERYEK